MLQAKSFTKPVAPQAAYSAIHPATFVISVAHLVHPTILSALSSSYIVNTPLEYLLVSFESLSFT